MFRVKEGKGGNSPGRQQEYTVKGGGGGEKEHEKCMTMEECGCSQCGS